MRLWPLTHHNTHMLTCQLKSECNLQTTTTSLLMIFQVCGRQIYFKALGCVHIYICSHTLYTIWATHAWQLKFCAKAIYTLTKCFSHFLFSCAKGHSGRNTWLSERDLANWRQKSSKAFPALCFQGQIFFCLFSPSYSMILFVFLEFKA